MKFNKKAFSEFVRLGRGHESLREKYAKSKISIATISRIENGKTPELETFIALCSFYNTSPMRFISKSL